MSRYATRTEATRAHAQAVTAPQDGLQQGLAYSAVVAGAETSMKTVPVTIPALHLSAVMEAHVPVGAVVTEGTSVMITFDENKIPWITSSPSLVPTVWTPVTEVSSKISAIGVETRLLFSTIQMRGAMQVGAGQKVKAAEKLFKAPKPYTGLRIIAPNVSTATFGMALVEASGVCIWGVAAEVAESQFVVFDGATYSTE